MANPVSDRRGSVIVGAGVVGCGTAYHLARYGYGYGDVAVVDRGEIPASVHAEPPLDPDGEPVRGSGGKRS